MFPRRLRSITLLGVLGVAAGCAVPTVSERSPGGARTGEAAEPSYENRLAELREVSGFLRLFVDDAAGRVFAEFPPPADDGTVFEFLYVESLRRGLGSNPIGLDRGQLGADRIVRVRRLGGRVLFEVPNLAYRAVTTNAREQRAVEDSFASSILWGGEIAAVAPGGELLVDLTTFLIRDAHGVAKTLADAGEGTFALDRDRSALDLSQLHAFPDNVEVEAWLTFGGKPTGRHVRRTVPVADSVSLIQHHSFIRLPDADYEPRRFDPRCGAFSISYRDYAAPLDAPLDRRFVTRHRLEKTDPTADRSPPTEPIVYYVDPGAPEPIFGALVRGASWWNEAFTAAGFENAFRVERLPDHAHPLDVRYNVIQWVHRSTRGWSYGASVIDPRTGEILKGHVSLGSLRVRQDRLLFEALAGVAKTGTGEPDDPITLALRRIEQLSAHEVGHTLGLAHNFAASTYDGRASVMDYPAPWVRADRGELDFTEAYGRGVGSWDVHAIRYLYTPFEATDEERALERHLAEGVERGLRYVTDADSRAPGSAHPWAHLWDNGEDPLDEFENTMAVRRIALNRFGGRNLAEGRPAALLHELFVLVYLYHRYQLEAVAKSIAGVEFEYSVAGDGRESARPVAANRQRRALALLLSALQPNELDVPEAIVRRLVPRPPGHGASRELFASDTSPAFDRIGAAATLARSVFALLFDPQRCARLIDQSSRDSAQLSLVEVFASLESLVAVGTPKNREGAIHAAVRRSVVDSLIDLAASARVTPAVRAVVVARLEAWQVEFTNSTDDHSRILARDIQHFFDGKPRPSGARHRAADPPPGSPIGAACGCGSFHGLTTER